MSLILNSSTVRTLAPDLDSTAPCAATTVLRVTGRGLTAVQNLGPIGTPAAPLRRLDVSDNVIVSLAGLAGQLSWLQASNNKLRGRVLVEVNDLPTLSFLGLSGNGISAIPSSALAPHGRTLRALLLNNNRLVRLEHIGHLHALTTLVCSHNLLEDVSAAAQLTALQKLSAGHNRIATIPCRLGALAHLAELRLNDNALRVVPQELSACQSLRLVDLGNNALADWAAVEPLGALGRLVNLTLRGSEFGSARTRLVFLD